MTKMHFIALAAEISKIENRESRLAAAIAVVKAAWLFNDRFDQSKFLDACEV
jgi:hypothetical protein